MNFSLRVLALNFFILANFIFLSTDEKKLPEMVNHPLLRTLIEDDAIYVDKTRYLAMMLKQPRRCFFLARPRRFGKSLLVDMMVQFFRGNEELFKGLYIHDECPIRPYPVINIDFSEGISVFSVDDFRRDLTTKLVYIAKSYGINDLDINMSPESALSQLILTLDSGNHSKVVVLIDEYDYVYRKSYMRTSGPDMLDELQNFFSTLKGLFDHIHFCFFTGITRIVVTDFFSSISFDDLTMDPAYASIVGFTQDELEENFDDYIQIVADILAEGNKTAIFQEMESWFDGYQFTSSDERVYNPCSVVSYLSSNGSKKNFWTESGGSKFYHRKMKEYPLDLLNMIRFLKKNDTKSRNERRTIPEYALKGHIDLTPKSLDSLETLLFHCGYLSIDKTYGVGEMGRSYTLRFPNQEVRTEFIARISQFLFGPLKPSNLQKVATAVREAIDSYQWENFIKILNSYYAQTPWPLYRDSSSKERPKEKYYQTLFHCAMAVAGFDWIELEVTTASGDADVVMESESVTYITEVKLEENKENPLFQCLKKYSGKFLEFHKEQIICIGLVFSVEKQIVKWGVAVLSRKGDVLEHHGNIGIEGEEDTKLKTVEDSGIDEKIEMSPEEIKIATVVKAYLSEHQLSTLPLEQVIKFLRQMKGTRNDLELFKTMTADLETFCQIIKQIVQSPPKVLKQGPLKTKMTKFLIKFCV